MKEGSKRRNYVAMFSGIGWECGVMFLVELGAFKEKGSCFIANVYCMTERVEREGSQYRHTSNLCCLQTMTQAHQEATNW